ncbi:MAG: class I SAM-dependent methyltransferase [Candidatus Babeliales bacterium]
MFLDDKPSQDEIPMLYSSRYYTVNPRSPLYLRGLIYRAKLKSDLKRVVEIIKTTGSASVLECGCGNIQRLIGLRKIFEKERLRLVGIDLQLTREAREAARQYDIELLEGNADHLSDYSGLGRFDLVLMSQILEHLDAPENALATIHKHMSKNAKILIETPCPGGLDFLLFHRRFWGGYHIPRHFYIFPQRCLVRFLNKLGFKVVKTGSMPSPGFWIISFRNALGLNSIERSSSRWEFISFHNIFVVAVFTFLDLLLTSLFLRTSNQFVIAQSQ